MLTMIKLLRATAMSGRVLRLEFSDGTWGEYDFEPLLQRPGSMVVPLREPSFFARFFIDEGALAWPNGFDLSAGTLHRRLADANMLQRPRAAE